MIENEDEFTYIGQITRGPDTVVVFQQGILIINRDQPGWGVMHEEDLEQLFSSHAAASHHNEDGSASRSGSGSDAGSASRSGSGSDTGSGSDDDDESGSQSGSTRLSTSTSSSAEASEDSSGQEHPPGHAGPVAQRYRPRAELGWHPSEAPVRVIPLTEDSLTRFLHTPSAQRPAFLTGSLPAPGPGRPAVAAVAQMVCFGEPHFHLQLGSWFPAAPGNRGFTAAQAAALAARSKLSLECDLSSTVVFPPNLQYQGLAQNDQTRLLAFDQGLLVLEHPDPELRGWHDMTAAGRWAMVSEADMQLIDERLPNPYAEDPTPLLDFLAGNTASTEPATHFYAVVHSIQRQQWRAVHVAPPLSFALGHSEGGLNERQVQQALSQATRAPFNDRQYNADRDPLTLNCGRWNVPWLLGAVQLLTLSHTAPALLGPCWHDTLQPALQHLLQAHRAQEKAWLGTGSIRQPIEGLLALARRDVRLRRPEVFLSWPAAAISDLFNTLAPSARVQVVTTPTAAALDKAFASDKPVLLLFQSKTSTDQDAVIVLRGRVYANSLQTSHPDEDAPMPYLARPLDALKPRLQQALTSHERERLVAMVIIP